ncbi:MAG: hypothetical protein R2747_09355 [Pyrinomonadaceae bacterium]
MRFIGLITRLFVLFMFLAISILAGDLRNEDGRRYEVKVYEGATTRNTWIDGNSTISGICNGCEIEVVGVGRIKVGGSDRIAIKNGKFVKQ